MDSLHDDEELRAAVAREYDLVEWLGEGTHGVAYKARRISDGSHVVIKRLKPAILADEKFRMRLAREYQILNELDHPHVVRAQGLRLGGPVQYLVLEYISGISADKMVSNLGALSVEEVYKVATQVCSALQAAHALGIIHRDIKPENILLTDKGAQIADFGLGLILGAPRLTRQGELVGTVETMPPEQLLGDDLSATADIYAFGATLYYLATGYQYLPFTTNLATNIRLVLNRWGITPPHLLNPRVPRAMSEVIMKCLATDPASRYQTAAVLKEELERLAGLGLEPDDSSTLQRATGLGIPRQMRQVVPSGSLALDIALGIGGWPRGRIVEIFGPSGCGKTTLAMHAIAEAQKDGGTAALIDADHAVDPFVAERCGVDIDSVYFIRPASLEENFAIIETLLQGNMADVIIVDSVAALLPLGALQGEITGVQDDPVHTQIVKNGLRRIIVELDRSKAALLFTNQLDVKIGVMFGNPETTSFGTHALQYFASMRVDLRVIKAIHAGGEVIGHRVRAKVKKSRFTSPYREAEFEMMFANGISREGDVLDLGIAMKIITKEGESYYFSKTRLGKGREDAKSFLRQYPGASLKIENRIRDSVGLCPIGLTNQDGVSDVLRLRRRRTSPRPNSE